MIGLYSKSYVLNILSLNNSKNYRYYRYISNCKASTNDMCTTLQYLLSRLPRKSNRPNDKHDSNDDLLKRLGKTFRQFDEMVRQRITDKNEPNDNLGSDKLIKKPKSNNTDEDKTSKDFEKINDEFEREQNHLKYSLLLFIIIIAPALYLHNFSEESRAVEISYREFVNNILLPRRSDSSNEPIILNIVDNSKVFIDNAKYQGNECFFYVLDSSNFEKHLKNTLQNNGLNENDVKINYSNSLLKLTRLGVLLIGAYVWIFIRMLSYFYKPSTMPRLVDLAKARVNASVPSRAVERKNYVPIISDKRFSDVIGYKEQKQELMEFVDFLKNPVDYHEMGAKIPRGAVLYGPPGTGKTLLAKAVAGEAGVNFFSASGSEFQQLFIGVGPQRIKDLFEDASKTAPSIIFIDEIDSIAISRAKASKQTHNENTATLNQLLALMDGFKTNTDVVILAATNRFDQLDPAILRPGRFDRHILFGSPDLDARTDMFKYYLKNTPLENSIDYVANRMALMTTGFVGADINLICNEAAIFSARDDNNVVRMTDFEKAIDRVIIGSKSSVKLQPLERQIVSLRESAKAVIAWFNKDAQPILKVSIIPRGQELAYSQKYVKEEYLTSKQKLNALLLVLLSGRAVEEVVLKQLYSVSSSELLKITNLVYKQVGVFGMGDSVKNISFQSLSLDENSLFPVRPEYDQTTQNEIDSNVQQVIRNTYKKSKLLVSEHKDLILKLAKFLYENEQADNKDLISILGERPYTDDVLRRIDE